MGEQKMSTITNVITLGEYADKYDMDAKRLRRIARKNEFPGDVQPVKWGGKNGRWAIDANAPAVELPAKSARGARRPDGRQRHIVYCNTVELTAIKNVVGDDNIIDPRIAAKQRRDARKTENDVNE